MVLKEKSHKPNKIKIIKLRSLETENNMVVLKKTTAMKDCLLIQWEKVPLIIITLETTKSKKKEKNQINQKDKKIFIRKMIAVPNNKNSFKIETIKLKIMAKIFEEKRLK